MGLVKKLKNKDEDAYQYIMNKYQNIFMYMANKTLHNHEDSLECVQDIFLKVYMHIDDCIEDDKMLNSWIFTIAKRQICDYKRKQACKEKLLFTNNELVENISDFEYKNNYMLDELKDFIGEEDFELLTYYIVGKLTFKEIGLITDEPYYKVSKRIKLIYEKSKKFMRRSKINERQTI